MTDTSNLAKLREPFPANQISKLPKPTKAQTEAVKENFRNGIRCQVCGGWHHPDVIHLDYVGHAALTDRLLDTDPEWNWEPASGEMPMLDANGGMWIKLTVCGVTRYGYGHAEGKRGGDAIKEVIGDAIRNAAMRFGAALDLWHKGDLHAHLEDAETPSEPPVQQKSVKAGTLVQLMNEGDDFETARYWRKMTQEQQELEYKRLDKETQKALKALLKTIPAEVKEAS